MTKYVFLIYDRLLLYDRLQKWATRMTRGLEHVPCEERLKGLENRQLRGDVREVYKIMHGIRKS